MPNHVTTILTGPSEAIRTLINNDGDEPRVDFNTVIPMPETVFHGPLGAQEERDHPGEQNWYGWSTTNWGTKWNAYDYEEGYNQGGGETTITFQTAWAHPYPVIDALSRQYPDANFHVAYADEDLGYNFGEYTITNGVLVSTPGPQEGSDAALDFASELKCGMTYAEIQKQWEE